MNDYQHRLKKYTEKMSQAINNFDYEAGHGGCDDVLCELLTELGYKDVVDIYLTQIRCCA